MCWNYTGNKKVKGDVIVDDVAIAKDLDEKQLALFMKEKADEAEELGTTLDEYLVELANDIKRIDFIKSKNWILTKLRSNYELLDEIGFILFRGRKDWLDKYIKYIRLSPKEQDKLLKEAYEITEKNSGKVYKVAASNKKLSDIGVQYYIRTYQKGAKVTPDFSAMGIDMFMKSGKLGNGKYDLITAIRKYSEADVLDALNKIRKFKGSVKVNVTSNRPADFKNCWKAMGIDTSLGGKIEKHLKLTWHHLDDLDRGLNGTFQLVHSVVHHQTKQHMGSHFMIEELLKLIK